MGYCIGLMSGTSIDGLDGVLAGFKQNADGTSLKFEIAASHSLPWPDDLKASLHKLCTAGSNELELSRIAANHMAKAASCLVKELLEKSGHQAGEIDAIGSHGQTLRHHPQLGFTIQLDNPALLAALTGIDVIADFRAADVANHGQGAPLTPLFNKLLQDAKFHRILLNIGGISNFTVISSNPGAKVFGFDSGPGNTLIDLSCRELFNLPFDKDAAIAQSVPAQGIDESTKILGKLLKLPFFKLEPPKSTGRELFNRTLIADLLDKALKDPSLKAPLIRALTHYTIICNIHELKRIRESLKGPCEFYLMGGGARNPLIAQSLKKCCRSLEIEFRSVKELGLDEQYMEALAFAYFAYLFVKKEAVNMQEVTGALGPEILGALYPAPQGAFSRGVY